MEKNIIAVMRFIWRLLPRGLGPWKTVYYVSRQWDRDGLRRPLDLVSAKLGAVKLDRGGQTY